MSEVVPRPPTIALHTLGAACVVLGGLVAAATDPLDLAHGSWLAAYLVLVGGVAQYVMGHARTWPGATMQPPGVAWTGVGAWNLGNAGVIAGTLADAPVLVDAGSALLVLALVVAVHAAGRAGGILAWGYRLLLVVLLVSIPIGIVLSYVQG